MQDAEAPEWRAARARFRATGCKINFSATSSRALRGGSPGVRERETIAGTGRSIVNDERGG